MAWALVARSTAMHGMVDGLAQVAAPMAMTLAAPTFLGMWVGMMVAMMFPTAVPLVAAHRLVGRRRGDSPWTTAALVAGYLSTWSVAGVVPFAVLVLLRDVATGGGETEWLPVAAGGILVAAGLYQFTGWKTVCLRTCRSPLAFVARHDFAGGARSAVRAGFLQGTYCLGCCWALMTVLLVVGLMNLLWMAVLSLVFIGEKVWRRGWALPRFVGVALVGLGVAIALHPPLLGVVAEIPDLGTTSSM
ncbi:DUF2182 domain-containing protein [Georgenia daeguensis]|uniref:DUF2182 domain-containing protein n=1 Tax=Georgenia daeguensis TaxID=908355 RepID=UPI0031E9158F